MSARPIGLTTIESVEMSFEAKLLEAKSFGGIDAEADELLKACFQDHPAFISVNARERFLVLGRKGSGKTSIFKRLIQERDPARFAFGYTFDDYPWHHHDLQAQVGVPEERRYIHSWKYLILLSLAKILLNSDSSQPWSDDSADALSALEDFVVDSYGSRDPDLTQLFSPKKELKLRGGISLKFLEISSERIAVEHLPAQIQEVNREMERAVFAAMNPECEYFVCFDQLDLGFTVTEQAYAQRLTGLLIAAKDLFVAGKGSERSFNPVIFLRDDIYEDLQFEDKNKISENFAVEVEWREAGTGLTLKSLMERRFAEVLGDGAGVAWDEVFDESSEMPSRQTKYRHICDRTFLRPRDVIKFCNEILAQYQAAPDGDLIGNPAVHAARETYSDYLLRELDDEIAKHVPSYKSYLEVLKNVGSEQFEFDSFAEEFDKREELAGNSPVGALEQLFEFSVIGYLKSGGRGGGSAWVWRYKGGRARFDSNAGTYRVHPGFKEVLDLKR